MKFTKLLSASCVAALAVSAVAAIPSSAADTYHAYLGVQSASYTFRNAWNEGTYGLGAVSDDGMVYFDQLTGWDGATPLNKGGDFVDTEITADGTYSVSVTNFDFGEDESLNLLFVSTDIPLDAGITISDVKIVMDGNTKYTFDEAYLSPDEAAYVQPMAINIWNDDLGKQDGLFGYMMPSDSIEVQFTVSGMGDAAADTTAETADASADVAETTTAAATGNVTAGAIAAVMAVAGAAVVATKKKN